MSSTIYESCVSHKQKTDIVLNVHKVKPLSVPMKIGVFRVIDINENYEKKRSQKGKLGNGNIRNGHLTV